MSQRLLFVDTETTGLFPDRHRLVEVAAIELDEAFRPVRVFHEYLDPQRSVGGTVRIHGLSDAFLRGRQTFPAIASDFVSFISGGLVIAHNLSFDQRFLDAELFRAGHRPITHYAQTLDTLAMARRRFPSPNKLDNLIERFGIDASARARYHGALIDAELLAKVYLCLIGEERAAKRLAFDQINDEDARYQASIEAMLSR